MPTRMSRTTTPSGHDAWLVTDYETVRRLLSDPRLGLTHDDPDSAGRLSDSVIFGRPQKTTPTDGQDHTRMRKLLGQWFSARRLAAFTPRVRGLVDGLLDELAAAPRPADFHRIVSFPLPALVISDLLGVPYTHRERFRAWSDEAADMHDQARSEHGRAELAGYIAGMVHTRLREPGDDLLSSLVQAHRAEPEGFTLDKVVTLGMTLLFAGHETTVTAIDTGAVLMAMHPAQRSAFLDEARLPDAVEEILRGSLPRTNWFATPEPDDIGGALPRWANTDLEFGGETIRKGEMVLLGLAHANVDEDLVGAEQGFDARRHPNRHLTFGHGAHFCVGAPLARLELQELFSAVAERFPGFALAVPLEELEQRADLLTGGLKSVNVTW
ncbi:cytochrome P450 [Actinokineospora sp. PR83]|uniref:cytochrome P450 n=1 Tax=Actinokineospora sp. PR83 TaxID=2884908 RepID=UPI001F3BF7DE|nr:cytochrome P450 [Actinokineospora sp. PR83]MCG8916952.1 cytochrome P450 [Actinokineospora sp. PR83]